MTLLEFVRKLQTPDGRIECAAAYGECDQKLTAAESDNFDLREEIKSIKFESERIDKTDLDEARKLVAELKQTIAELESEKLNLWKRVDTAQLTAKMLNLEIETMRKLDAKRDEELRLADRLGEDN